MKYTNRATFLEVLVMLYNHRGNLSSRKMRDEIAINARVTEIWRSNLYETLLLVSYHSGK